MIYKYKGELSLAGVAATADLDAATGINAGGPFAGVATAVSGVGVVTAIAAGAEVSFGEFVAKNSANSQYKHLEFTFTGAKTLNAAWVKRIPHSGMGLQSNELIYQIESVNIVSIDDRLLYKPTDAFRCDYKRDLKVLDIVIPHADRAAYPAGGKLLITIRYGSDIE